MALCNIDYFDINDNLERLCSFRLIFTLFISNLWRYAEIEFSFIFYYTRLRINKLQRGNFVTGLNDK